MEEAEWVDGNRCVKGEKQRSQLSCNFKSHPEVFQSQVPVNGPSAKISLVL